jgi:hypothetical protein
MRKLLGLLTLAGVAAAVVASMPDIKRYLRMRSM